MAGSQKERIGVTGHTYCGEKVGLKFSGVSGVLTAIHRCQFNATVAKSFTEVAANETEHKRWADRKAVYVGLACLLQRRMTTVTELISRINPCGFISFVRTGECSLRPT